jgi:hypothetical protein
MDWGCRNRNILRADLGSLGIAVVNPRILGCERAYVRSHPKMRLIPQEILENPDVWSQIS